MTTQLTRNYWLDVFAGWVEARDMPGPQNDEALQVINELKSAELLRRLEEAQAYAGKVEGERDDLHNALTQLRAREQMNQAIMIEAGEKIDELRGERDAARLQLQQICTMLDDGNNGNANTALDMVKRLQEQCRVAQREAWYTRM